MSDDTKALVTHGLRLSVALSAEDVRALDAFVAQLGASQAATIERLERERGTLLSTGTAAKPQWTPLGARIAELERELAEARTDRDALAADNARLREALNLASAGITNARRPEWDEHDTLVAIRAALAAPKGAG